MVRSVFGAFVVLALVFVACGGGDVSSDGLAGWQEECDARAEVSECEEGLTCYWDHCSVECASAAECTERDEKTVCRNPIEGNSGGAIITSNGIRYGCMIPIESDEANAIDLP